MFTYVGICFVLRMLQGYVLIEIFQSCAAVVASPTYMSVGCQSGYRPRSSMIEH